jgi:hypothetical protein
MSLKSLYLFIIFNLTHLKDGNTMVNFMFRILYELFPIFLT